MAKTVAPSTDYIDNPELLDEDRECRRQLLQALELSPTQRLSALRGAYPIFLIGLKRLGHPVFGEHS